MKKIKAALVKKPIGRNVLHLACIARCFFHANFRNISFHVKHLE